MCTIIALKSHCSIKILKQFSKIDICLALYTTLVEQELNIIMKKIKESAACVHCTYTAVPKDVFFLAFK